MEEKPEDILSRIHSLGYDRTITSLEAILFAGEARYHVLEWLLESLGGTLPSTCRSPRTVTDPRGVEEVRIQGLADTAFFMHLLPSPNVEVIQGQGSYDERLAFLEELVSLVEAIKYPLRPEWTTDMEVLKYFQLADTLLPLSGPSLSTACVLFPPERFAELHAISLAPSTAPSLDDLTRLLEEKEEIAEELQATLAELCTRTKLLSKADGRRPTLELKKHLAAFLEVAAEFVAVYEKELRLKRTNDKVTLKGLGPLAHRVAPVYRRLQETLGCIHNLRNRLEGNQTGEDADPSQKDGDNALSEIISYFDKELIHLGALVHTLGISEQRYSESMEGS